MSNAKPNVYTNSSFRSDIMDSEYEEVVVDYQSLVYDDARSVQKADPSNVVRSTLQNSPQRKAVTHSHQKIQISLPLLFLIIICSLIAIILTGVVTFFITKDTLPERQYAEKQACYWSSWSFWSKCSTSCGNGTQVRIRQQMNNTRLCSYNETHDDKICYRGKCPGDDVLIDMKFSRTALFKYWFISADKKILSNVHTHDTSSSDDAQLQNYRGTISNTCVANNEIIYYEVNYTYTVVKTITGDTLVLELGLADRSKVDINHSVAFQNVGGWSFFLAKIINSDKVNLFSHNGSSRLTLKSISDVTAGTKIQGKFKLSINRRRHEFSLKQDDSIFHVFKNVTSSKKLCPVFAVYNPDLVHVKLQLINSRDFTRYQL
ncbi:uncharacterized protein LOC143082789 [Mytilus galloprovincialis]|uniref:uncharacterized protein LOC143082789 n=1 Tax=Mytilus galloprovincialis TaxID=29158 RepID=UPI003F7B971E